MLICKVSGQGIEFFQGTYGEALEKARQENKQLFVDVYTSWCGPCKLMAKEVFSRQDVGTFFNAHYISLQLDAEKEKDCEFFKNYQANGYPTFFWLDAQGKALQVHTGYTEADAFIEIARQAATSDLNQRLENGRQRWEGGERSAALVKEYVLGTISQIRPDTVKSLLLDYLGGLSREELQKQENYQFLQGFMRNAEDNLAFRTLIKNAEVYCQYDSTFWKKMYRMVVRSGILLRNDQEKFSAYREFLSSLQTPLSEMYLEILAMEEQLFQGNYPQGLQQALQLTERYQTAHPYLAGEFFYTLIIAHYFDQTTADRSLTELAVDLADQALTSTPSKETLLYLAAAYAHQQDYKRAYELLASLPFFPDPMLSNALYPALKLPIIHRNYLKTE